MKTADFQEIAKGLFLIPLDQKQRGFRNFISSWVLQTGTLNLLVDPGPKATIPALVKVLSQLGISHLDYILLTHIHIDHAGGAGLLCQKFPRARVVCHFKAIKHLIDPSALWEASKKALGPLAEVYGEIVPVGEERIFFAPEIKHGAQSVVVCLETPGHAAHHISYIVGDVLFAGEVAGVFQDLGYRGYYLRPATPPIFYEAPYVASIDRLAGEKAAYLCFGHFGAYRDAAMILAQARGQLQRWLAVIKAHMPGSKSEIIEKAFFTLKEKDPLFALFDELDPDIQERERYFFSNTVQGIMGFLEDDMVI
jgi:glyoxylase-like metal-dependent hydrolase (beta-lactamase superfamily II)